ncbi:hypothetical protein GYMLUDRAFT_40064 [Collybiopsis luxurians FD-317 M1]|nr:hypothetical protein GYMLUDRAFT_40064 [Collybiopsis luxurians FD-317 M1]
MFYSGSGYTLNYNNPGNWAGHPPMVLTLDGSTETCTAIQTCANAARAQINVYYTFDLHYDESVDMWYCVQFYDYSSDAGLFNVADANVIAGYGFIKY